MDTEPLLRRVKIRNYKSIGSCDVTLQRLTILLGRNGSGKSNFLDALRFVMDGLQTSLDHAITSRGGLDSVRRRSTGHPRNIAIELEMSLAGGGRTATYGFEIADDGTVKQEQLVVPGASYRVQDGNVVAPTDVTMPPASPDRLYLVNAAGLPQFREPYDMLLRMGFYNLNPEVMKPPQSHDAAELLQRDGRNIASILGRMGDSPAKERIKSYLGAIVPGIVEVLSLELGMWEMLEFQQKVSDANPPLRFFASSMSDGTLRALGALVAVAQVTSDGRPLPLVGIEEPETALHPAAAGALMDAIREAASHTQVIVTSHSPDLLDQIESVDRILAVQSRQGDTAIGKLDDASRETIRKHLYTPGELLRMDQLAIDPKDLARQRQLTLFDLGPETEAEEPA